jgi:DNA-directed RNA polymerase specialized sigma24 family protein
MNKEPPTEEAFNKLLVWLDADREKAADKYEKIRLRLIKIFACHGCIEPEKLADETIDRVMLKIDWLVENYVGEPTLFFCGVARNVIKEDLRGRVSQTAPPPIVEAVEDDGDQEEYDCLDQCMQKLPETNRHLVLAYYEDEGHAKIVRRSKLAKELGITLRALRLRTYHIRLQLRACMEGCLRQNQAH